MKTLFVIVSEMKVKGGMLDTWSAKEKLALGCSVQRSGDQNWSVIHHLVISFMLFLSLCVLITITSITKV